MVKLLHILAYVLALFLTYVGLFMLAEVLVFESAPTYLRGSVYLFVSFGLLELVLRTDTCA